MLKKFEEIWGAEMEAWRKTQVFLAISGGKDSMALSHILIKLKINHTLLHCNFKLRGQNADDDEEFIKDHARKNNLHILTQSFDTKKISQELNLTIQETARKLRYDWFDTIIKDPQTQLLFTAHHATDSVETFFINLMRGTGLKGLTGIPLHLNYILRPLSAFSVKEIEVFLNENSITYREDESNKDIFYTRNFIRNKVIPIIESRSESFDKKMNTTIDSLNEVFKYLKDQTLEVKNEIFIMCETHCEVPLSSLSKIDKVILAELFSEYGVNRSQRENFLLYLKSKNNSLYKTKTHVMIIQRNTLYIQTIENYNKWNDHKSVIEIEHVNSPIDSQEMSRAFMLSESNTIRPFSEKILQWDADKVQLPIKIRKWAIGDKFIPLGMNGSKLVSDFIVDKKINIIKKQRLLVVVDRTDTIIGLVGYTVSENHKVSSSSSKIITLKTTTLSLMH